jgi:hypothetical protein
MQLQLLKKITRNLEIEAQQVRQVERAEQDDYVKGKEDCRAGSSG